MENCKEIILGLVSQPTKKGVGIQEIVVACRGKTTKDLSIINQCLNELEEDVLIVRNKGNRYFSAASKSLFRGIFSKNRKGFGFVDCGDKSFYIASTDIADAMHGDEVVVQSIDDGGIIKKVVTRNTTTLVGKIVLYRRNFVFESIDARISNYMSIKKNKEIVLHAGLMVQVKILTYNPLLVEIVRVIGDEDGRDVDIRSICLDYGVEFEFNADVQQEADSIPLVVMDEDCVGRIDHTSLKTITIDGDDAKDFDDAVSIEPIDGGYRCYVHIADVSHYVTINSALDKEARKRGTSTYIANRVAPMLPFSLSNGICSLNPHVKRCTLTCAMDVMRDGSIEQYSIYPSLIISDERCTYHNVNEILEHGSDEFLSMLQECAGFIRKRRESDGAIAFDSREAKIVLNDMGKPIDIGVRSRGESEGIIEDLMISANECVAKQLMIHEIPGLYRVHEQPSVEKLRIYVSLAMLLGKPFKGNIFDIHPKELQQSLESFSEEECYPIVSDRLLRVMSKARYDRLPLGHFGLALRNYCHFTSPIRRYPDLIVHRMLRKYWFNQTLDVEEIKKDELLMDELAVLTSERERASIEAERACEDLKKAEFMMSHVGKVFEGVISSITNFGFFVELDNTIEGLVRLDSLNDYYTVGLGGFELTSLHNKSKYRIGQVVTVKVSGVSVKDRTIDFSVVTKKKKKKQQWI